MHWVLWALVFASINVPILTLLADRILGVPAPRVIRYGWLPAAAALGLALAVNSARDGALVQLVAWGAVGGLVATGALDVVRLFGHHVLRAFPVDMPQVFGMLALGLGPRLQEHMIAGLVAHLASVDPETRRRMMAERLEALGRLPEPVRVSVVRGMRRGVSALAEGQRLEILQTQMSLLAELPAESRRAVMRAMDLAGSDGVAPAYAQPRGMPRIPMHLARRILADALPRAAAEAGVSRAAVLLVGYGWHVLNGVGFGIAYTLLVGSGSWPLAVAWGIVIWAGMMVTMPVMMPTIRFPMPGFLVVPLLAHLAMAVPIGYYARFAAGATAASLLGGTIR
jgi:hypothetical protein